MANAPKVFISYCWSTPDHEQWVVDLATQLSESGIDVKLDKWDLKEGHDAIAFMESMVTDSTIDKVLVVCDRLYAEKANGRTGGVGTETQIITSEIYRKSDQNKFVAVIAERLEDGSAALPTFCKSRIYVDLSRPEVFSENFEKLVRCVFDKPLYRKPAIGQPPSYILDPDATSLPTSALALRANEAFRAGKTYSLGALDEYLGTFSSSLEILRLDPNTDDDDLIFNSIDQFLPYRDELLGVVSTVVRYGETDDYSPRLHAFLEGLLPYMVRPHGISSLNRIALDNYRFIIHEIFLHFIRVFIRSGQFEACNFILGTPYVSIEEEGTSEKKAMNFQVFLRDIESAKLRNQRLTLKRTSLRSDLLEQRARLPLGTFSHLMEADFVCFLRYEITRVEKYRMWWPETLLYTYNQYSPFDIFIRASSRSYLHNVLKLIGAKNLDQLRELIGDFQTNKRHLPHWNHDRLSVSMLMNLEGLGTLP